MSNINLLVLRRFVSGALLFLVAFLSFATTPVAAQTTNFSTQPNEKIPAEQDYATFNKNVNLANQTGVQNTDSYYGVVIINRVTLGLLRLLAGDGSSDPSSSSKGVVGYAGSMIGQLYAHPPASGVQYVADMMQEAHIVPKAYAQNIQGFNRLSPLIDIWKALRDLAYLAYIPIFVYVGIIIMFRQQAGKTAASVQMALPKIILSLVLVTFSFAIAGFLIDIMNFLMSVVANYFVQRHLLSATLLGDNSSNIYSKNIFSFVWKDIGVWQVAGIPGGAVNDIVQELLKGTPIAFAKNILGDATEGLVRLIMVLAVLYAVFRTFFTLLIAYVSVIFMTILGPILIVFDAVPGRSGFSFWFRSMIANLAVFPAVLALLLFAGMVSGSSKVAGDTKINFATDASPGSQSWVPPFIGAFTGQGAKTFGALIGFGAILLMPQALSQIQKQLKTTTGLQGLLAPASDAYKTAKDTTWSGIKGGYNKTNLYGSAGRKERRGKETEEARTAAIVNAINRSAESKRGTT